MLKSILETCFLFILENDTFWTSNKIFFDRCLIDLIFKTLYDRKDVESE